MIDWIKPNGTKLTTNDMEATVAYCEKMGWKREQEMLSAPKVDNVTPIAAKEAVKKVRRKRRTKAEMIADDEKPRKEVSS